MKRLITGCVLMLVSLTIANAQNQRQGQRKGQNRQSQWSHIGTYISKDSLTRGPYTLIFINKDSAFAETGSTVKQRMIDTFFEVYPKEAQRFNPNTATRLTFIIDPSYDGVAATSDEIIRYSPTWMLQHPNDIDVVTHEAFHVVQAYGSGAGPGWLTEGITDYVRYKYGVDNAGAGWTLPAYKPEQSYTNSYRITARFLAWLEKNVNDKIVDSLDASMRSHTYTPEVWVKLTGKTLDDLWQNYVQNPALVGS